MAQSLRLFLIFAPMSKFLIVGLGNIGPEYAHTRHNIGFDVVTAFVGKHGGSFQPGRLADVAEVKLKGKRFICIKPTTFMNLSGKALKYWMDKENIPLDQVLVVVDDLALPLHKLRLRPSGSAAGHNGLTDIEQTLATNAYPRLRFGIGNDFPRGQQSDFVLGKWRAEDEPLIAKKIMLSVEVIENFAFLGLHRAMGMINNVDITL
jgi:peptidyl-tRNA hydrolase, PTH1 family